MKQFKHKQLAVTLVELIIAITLTGIVAGILGTIMRQVSTNYIIARDVNETNWQTRLALFRLERELGETTGLVSATSSQLKFTSGQDGTTTTYDRSSTQLQRNSTTLADHISALTFTLLNSSFGTTTSLTDTRCIDINLTVTNENQTTPLTTVVCPRNLAWSA